MTTPRTCPVCSRALNPTRHDGLEVDACPAGCGLWLDDGELAAIVDKRSLKVDEDVVRLLLAGERKLAKWEVKDELHAPPRKCPVCRMWMRRRMYPEWSHVVIDVDGCGVWLDKGELERILAWHHAGQPTEYSRQDALQVHSEFQRLQADAVASDTSAGEQKLLGRFLGRLSSMS
jgi:Zn-finger nucleic acid-binding protein